MISTFWSRTWVSSESPLHPVVASNAAAARHPIARIPIVIRTDIDLRVRYLLVGGPYGRPASRVFTSGNALITHCAGRRRATACMAKMA
ncbi:hypothetical protein GCM10022251_05600 [Phytohabitans flavus]|uniref:Uncharacterized protein n=1 Tax=Phytohabitans flavus TaxID=1076124 RepID=A0A6F8Y2G0_9ACTN|nr:hypothetical protein Pflav_066850 [Phytohabitans flavus]